MKQSKNNAADFVSRLYESSLPSKRTGPLYNAFSYPTKISPEVIAVFIAAHTQPGQTVLDAFGGSGTTGLAAMLCDRPTEAMLSMCKSLGIAPRWGPRKAVLFEVGTLGAFVAKTLSSPIDPDEFSKAANELCRRASLKLHDLYAAKDPSGQAGTIRHMIWSDILVCPQCEAETAYWDAAVRHAPLSMAEEFTCAECARSIKIRACTRAIEAAPDVFGATVERKKRVPVRVYGRTGNAKWQRESTPEDIEQALAAEALTIPRSAPNEELVWGDLRRTGYHRGIERLHHFYTPRNFIAVATLWELADEFDDELRQALKLLILSYNASHSTLMARVVVKKSQKDLVLTGAQSGVLYVSGLPVEKNVIAGVQRKAKAFTDAFALIYGSKSQVVVHNASSEAMALPNGSIDYVFTDPPFGDYIPYAEINQINEIWLGEATDRSKEIIVSEAQGKSVDTYARMMQHVFGEIARVLKPGGQATVVFHSAHSEIWRALASAYGGAGLVVKATSILDKIQASFKQVVSEVAVKGDPLLLLVKEPASARSVKVCAKIAEEVIAATPGADPQKLYSIFIGRCLLEGVRIDMDAREFYAIAGAPRQVAP
ncbi:DNA methyltransferase [Lysobacter sp. A286]